MTFNVVPKLMEINFWGVTEWRRRRRTCGIVEAGFLLSYASETWIPNGHHKGISLNFVPHFSSPPNLSLLRTANEDLNARNGTKRENSNRYKLSALIYTTEFICSGASSINWSIRKLYLHIFVSLSLAWMSNGFMMEHWLLLLRIVIIFCYFFVSFIQFLLLTHTLR